MPVMVTTEKGTVMVPLHVLVPPDLKEGLHRIAAAQRRPFSVQVRMALERMVEEEAIQPVAPAKRGSKAKKGKR
jgi:hypothetical protein